MNRTLKLIINLFPIFLVPALIFAQTGLGVLKYDNFKNPKFCGASCHTDFYQQWKQAMMSQAYTHEWDEIEYFKLAIPHAEKDPKVAEVKAGCNGCHTPIAFVAGDVPPPLPNKNSRANESVSCDVCHSIKGFSGDIPFNFNYILEPGRTKFAARKGNINSPSHDIVVNDLLKSGDFCGICHNEKDPYGIWVKSTHLEWKEGPYSKEGVQCQDCHMTKAEFKVASMGTTYNDTKLHLFHGAHDPGKVKGVIELRIHPDIREIEPGESVKFTVALFNQKTGHKFPSGSVEDRIVWMHVEATDSKGNVYHIPVDRKGFPGEEYLIGSDVLAYQDMGIALNDPEFKGVQRDGIPIGDRIFRKPYFDPQGRMTIQQWNTASQGVDYRIGPRETKIETLTFKTPANIPPGKLKITAVLNYQLLVKPVADFLGVPASESEIVKVNEHSTEITILQ
jgi:hypothetical protein